MKRKPPTAPSNLSPDVVDAVRKHGVKEWVGDLVKSLLFWGIGLVALFATMAETPFFNFEKEPFWATVVVLLIVAFPVVLWKPYRIFTEREFRGTIVAYHNKRVVDHTEEDARGPFYDRGKMGTVDVYKIIVQDENGKRRSFLIKRANTEFGRVYYKKGDVVRCPPFARFPFNESRPLPRPFCIWCGSIGAPNETICTCCDSPYALIPEDGEFTPIETDLILEASTDNTDSQEST